ncbi:MAG: hypothetical protein LBM77_07700, partial [Spirochaetaceae bacterium]|nr:hypothetical protein [Spirochaetaceae bacterium]
MKKQKIIGYAMLSLSVMLITYSCVPLLDSIGEKPLLSGSISISPASGIKPSDLVMTDISGIDYGVKPGNYQWFCSNIVADSPEDIKPEDWMAIEEKGNEMTFKIPTTGDYIGKFIYVEVRDDDFSGSLVSEPVKVEAPPEPPLPEPGSISGLV